MPEASNQENIAVFCCYAQEDQALFRELKKHLMLLQREKYISLWAELDINAGIERKEEIYRHLNTAQIILLLVSADFMASDDCDGIKKRALERHKSDEAKVIPIILRPIDWWRDPLSALQALPGNSKPVTSWSDKDLAFSDIASGIRKIVEQLLVDRTQTWPIGTKAGQKESTSSSIASTRNEKWMLYSILIGHAMAVNSVAINTNRQILVSGSADKTIKVWDLSMGQVIQNLTGHTMAVHSVAISTDGQTLVSGSADKTIKVWDLPKGKLVQNLTGHIDIISSIAIGVGGQIVISGSYDKTVKVWDLSTRRCVRTLADCTDRIWSVAISTDEQIVACGCENGIIKVWNLDTGQVVHTLTDYSTSIISVAISSDGQTLVSGSNNTIKMWNLSTGQAQQTLTGHHTHAIYSIAISEDRHTLASGGYDNTIKVWKARLPNEK